MERLEENIKAINIELNKEDLKRIDEMAPIGAAAGTRYPEYLMSTVNK